MHELYPRDVVWPMFILVQDMYCEVLVHPIGEVCCLDVVCAVYAWPGMASLFVCGWSPVWTGDTWMACLA